MSKTTGVERIFTKNILRVKKRTKDKFSNVLLQSTYQKKRDKWSRFDGKKGFFTPEKRIIIKRVKHCLRNRLKRIESVHHTFVNITNSFMNRK